MTAINKFTFGILFIFLSCGTSNNLTRETTYQLSEMKKILTDLFQKSLTTKDNNYFTSEQIKNNWIGNLPATEREIKEIESKLGVELPIDYKNFLLISNGYPTYNDAVEPSFEKISQIQYLKDLYPEIIEIWRNTGNEDVSKELAKSIIIAGKQEEQWFLLIPPTDKNEK
ncbi:SMI1/KNR4 family protein [Aureibaculum flavum]|uniref:SMI1/KNR4 family protein n=1 Tax=Aureibaculum flavum TaxID=2795986 RepID=UPI001E3C1276|nr:SMI1/KNR4 family protein [Aureibaculum flavum]